MMNYAHSISSTIACLALILSAPVTARCQHLHWAKALGSADADEGTAITVSPGGQVYTCGNFQDTMDVDPGPAVQNIISLGSTDIFVSRLDQTGKFIWTKQIGNSGSESATGIASGAGGSIFITGTFLGTTDFDPGPGTFYLTSSASVDAFICKLDSSGNFLWARKFGANTTPMPQPVIANAIAVDKNGYVYTAGSFDGPADFDPGPGSFVLTPGGTYSTDVFISKLDSSGNFVWARQLSGTAFEGAYAIAVDSFSNVYTTGFFNGTVDFDPGPGIHNLTAPAPTSGLTDIFVSKLDALGNFSWACQPGTGTGHAIATGPAGHVYVSGDFPNDSTIIYKLDPAGNTLWAKQTGASICWALAVNAQYNIFLTGWFHGTKDLDPGAGTTNLTAIGPTDSYISKLDSAGNLLWAKQLGGTPGIRTRALALHGNDVVYTTGLFEGTGDFDPSSASLNFTSVGSMDIFIHKLTPENLGIDEAVSVPQFSIYPNPTAGSFVLELDENSGYTELELRNMRGQLLGKRTINRNESRILLQSGEAAGVYFLVLHDASGRKATARILKN